MLKVEGGVPLESNQHIRVEEERAGSRGRGGRRSWYKYSQINQFNKYADWYAYYPLQQTSAVNFNNMFIIYLPLMLTV